MNQKFYGYIYITLNQQTNKVYVGQKFGLPKDSINYLGSGLRLKNSIKHYGKQFFKKRILGILEADSKEELELLLNEAETECIYFYRSFGADGINHDEIYGYNLTKDGRTLLGFNHKQSTKDKMSKKQKGKKGKKQSQETISKRTLSLKGKKRTEETRKKQSEAAKNRLPFTEEHRKNLGISHKGQKAWNKGISCREETKQKLRESNKKKEPWNKGLTNVYSEETLKKLKESHKGQIVTQEMIEKRRNSRRKNIELKKLYLTQIAFIIHSIYEGNFK
jgi:hypothetical protein